MATNEVKGVTIEQALASGGGQRVTVFRKNSAHASAWHNDKLHFIFRNGVHLIFNPALASMKSRADAQRMGWQQRLNDCMAVDQGTPIEVKIDNLRTVIQHHESGTEEWDLPRTPSVGNEDLIARALVRMGKAKDVEAAKAMFSALAAKRNVEASAIVRLFGQSADVAKVVIEIRAEDALKRTEAMTVNIDDLLAEAGEEAE